MSTAVLDPQRLAKVCAMFSGDHAGERAAAAQLADKIVKAAGMT
jgi:hypothetical protein